MVLIVAVVLITLGYYASISTNSATGKRAELRERIAAMIVLEQIGVNFRQGFDAYMSQPGTPSPLITTCPTGLVYFMTPSTVAMCLSPQKTASCVQDPRTNLSANTLICSIEAPPGGFTFNEGFNKNRVIVELDKFKSKKSIANLPSDKWMISRNGDSSSARKSKVHLFDFLSLTTLLSGWEPVANADQKDLPPVAALGGQVNTITPPVAANFLQLCDGGTSVVSQYCITATVCMRSSCPSDEHKYAQIFGFAN